jgi:DSF synthase
MTQATTSLTLPPYRQLLTHIDTGRRAVWYHLNSSPRPAFTKTVLEEIIDLHKRVKTHLSFVKGPAEPDIQYLVVASAIPRVYSLGGDLDLFSRSIRERDRDALTEYARLCIDCVFGNTTNIGVPELTTISLVQGSALGGGFEAALSANVLIAERSATFGFPEIIFNLFAGMGAYSLLSRRIDPARADRMMRSGQQYSAAELYEMGLVDVLAEDGEGVLAVNEYIRRANRSRNGLLALQQVRQRLFPITYRELEDIVSIWVEAALRLTERDLRTMERLVSAQQKLSAQTHPAAVPSKKVEEEYLPIAGAA